MQCLFLWHRRTLEAVVANLLCEVHGEVHGFGTCMMFEHIFYSVD
jgi:hypothetical protein